MIKDYVTLAIRSARQRKIRSWLTMLGIFVGIAAVVSLISLSQGLKSAIETQFLRLGSDKLVVQAAGSGFGPPGTAVVSPLTVRDKDAIEQTNGVDLAVGRLIRIVKLRFSDEEKYTYAVSFPADSNERALIVEANDYQLAQGKFPDKQSKEIVIGHNFESDFFEKELTLREKIKIQDKEFVVVGILKKSGNPQQDNAIIIPEDPYREILSLKEVYDIIAVRMEKSASLNLVAEQMKKSLRKSREVEKGKEDFTVQTPENVIATFTTILTIVQSVLIGIAAISLLVGGIGIMNTMYTAVLERTREIGILKAVGATKRDILLLFLMESGMLGLMGGVIGVVLGVGISKTVELIAFQLFESPLIQTDFSVFLIFGALLFSFVIGIMAGIFPAYNASKLSVVEALRK